MQHVHESLLVHVHVGAPAGDMVWMPRADISELQSSSTALEGEEEYPDEFVAYLARYLLTYDDASKSYYSARLALPQVVAAAASSNDASSGKLWCLQFS
jgi:hypothetical protein